MIDSDQNLLIVKNNKYNIKKNKRMIKKIEKKTDNPNFFRLSTLSTYFFGLFVPLPILLAVLDDIYALLRAPNEIKFMKFFLDLIYYEFL